MRLLCQRIGLLGMVVLLVLAALWRLLPVDEEHFFAATIDKHRCLQQAGSPKIVLVGGSNLACGVDSEQLQAALGRAVVNMGLHADIGLAYMLAEVRPALADGDWVVIVAEYEQFFGLLNGRAALLKVMSYQPQGWRNLRTCGQWLAAAGQAMNFLQAKVKYFLETLLHVERDRQYQIYHRAGFNRQGDLITHLDLLHLPLQEDAMHPLAADKFDPHSLAAVNQFFCEMRAKGVRVLLIYPGCYDRLVQRNQPGLARLTKEFSRLQCPVLGSPERYAFPEECFYDTEYHLNRLGRTLRTQKMIQDLADWDASRGR
jgi:hypothetical protein